MRSADVIIIGGGAAGLMCAITAGQRGRSVIVLEGSNKIGKKILMSGGGRCNFTNLHTEPSRFISGNSHFCKSALSRYTQWDFIALVEKHGVAYHEKTLGQLFCDVSSKDIVTLLLDECVEAGVEVITDCSDAMVEQIDGFKISCSKGRFKSDSLVIASGGLSIPKMGASDFGYRVARQFDLNVLDYRAGLVPFTLTGALHDLSNRLSGVSCRVTVTANNTSFTEDMLFTHRGLSGPVMLQVSSYWQPGDSIEIDLMPGLDLAAEMLVAKSARPKSLLRAVLAERLPKALVAELQGLLWSDLSEVPMAEMGNEQLRQIADSLQCWSIKPAATEGYRTAEVTLGGVDTNELSSKTMESGKHPGLFFIGEVVDVTGHLGGFNFQWAWSSGHAAGQAV
jgi:predicted Rossmann fold flavoprotein